MTQGFRCCFRNFGRDLKLSVYRRDTAGGWREGTRLVSVAKMSKQHRRLLRHSCESVL